MHSQAARAARAATATWGSRVPARRCCFVKFHSPCTIAHAARENHDPCLLVGLWYACMIFSCPLFFPGGRLRLCFNGVDGPWYICRLAERETDDVAMTRTLNTPTRNIRRVSCNYFLTGATAHSAACLINNSYSTNSQKRPARRLTITYTQPLLDPRRRRGWLQQSRVTDYQS